MTIMFHFNLLATRPYLFPGEAAAAMQCGSEECGFVKGVSVVGRLSPAYIHPTSSLEAVLFC